MGRVRALLHRTPRLARLLLAAASVLATLLTLELGSRLVGDFPAAPDPLVTEGDYWPGSRRHDDLLFWSLAPGLRMGNLETNRLGLRGPEIPAKGQEFRILSLGESTTFGSRVRYEETYSALLERELAALGGKPVRVINAGVPGYSIFQGYQYLVHRGIDLQPDLVLLYFGFNDFLPVAYVTGRDANASDESVGLGDRELFALRQRPRERLGAWLSEHSNFVRAMRSLLRPRLARADVVSSPQRPRVPPADRRLVLGQLADFCEARGIELVIVVPWYLDFSAHADLLRRFAAERSVPLVDLPRELGGIGEAERAGLFADQLHPNAAGHARVAEVLSRALVPRLRPALRP